MDGKKHIIFDLTNPNYNYRGILFAEIDNTAVYKKMNAPFPTPKGYIAGVMAVVWTDEKGKFHTKLRIKYPCGNKHICTMDFDEEEYEKVNVNVTYVLNEIYKMPMIHKVWTPNPCGTGEGILEIIRKLDMIESARIIIPKEEKC